MLLLIWGFVEDFSVKFVTFLRDKIYLWWVLFLLVGLIEIGVLKDSFFGIFSGSADISGGLVTIRKG